MTGDLSGVSVLLLLVLWLFVCLLNCTGFVDREFAQLSVKGVTDYEYDPVDEYGSTSIQVEKYQIERLPSQDAFSDLVSTCWC